uniref:Uncharacterized protein n=1 Tax=Fagus sylvatica TaxID=28930 RepID=A0A2N9FZJ0_FAGSY
MVGLSVGFSVEARNGVAWACRRGGGSSVVGLSVGFSVEARNGVAWACRRGGGSSVVGFSIEARNGVAWACRRGVGFGLILCLSTGVEVGFGLILAWTSGLAPNEFELAKKGITRSGARPGGGGAVPFGG